LLFTLFGCGAVGCGSPTPVIGPFVDGKLIQAKSYQVLGGIRSINDLNDVDPSFHLYAEILRPVIDFPAPVPDTLIAAIRAFNSDSTGLGAGAPVEFVLTLSDSKYHRYQSAKPIILVNNPVCEGDAGNYIAIFTDQDCSLRISRLPP